MIIVSINNRSLLQKSAALFYKTYSLLQKKDLDNRPLYTCLLDILELNQRIHDYLASKANPDWPSQPRVPRGHPDGGQWTGPNTPDNDDDQPKRYIDDPPLESVYPELLILPLLRTPKIIASFQRLIQSIFQGKPRDWRLGDHKSYQKWTNRLEAGNWTAEKIDDTIKHGRAVPAPNKINQQNTATCYIDRQTGRFVVKDDVTKEILQVSRPGHKPESFSGGKNDPRYQD
jgi:Colicin E5 ribonuclease domain